MNRCCKHPGAHPVMFTRFGLAWLALVGLTMFGCRGESVAESDIDQATQLITTSLEAWKAGETVASLRDRKPPVYVSDEQWEQGVKLEDFKITAPGEQFGTNIRFQVEMVLGGGRNAGKKSLVKYLVTTTPALTIAREDR